MNNVYLKFGWYPNNKESCCTSPDAENTIYFPQPITDILTFTKFLTLSLLDKQFIQEFVMKNGVSHSKLCGNTCTTCRP